MRGWNNDDIWSRARDVLRRAWDIARAGERQSQPIAPSHVVLVGPKPVVTVTPPSRSAWDDRGWTVQSHEDGRLYQGQYTVSMAKGKSEDQKLRRFDGWIMEPSSPGTLSAYVADPPAELRRHPKGPCFQLARPPWFRVHWVHPAESVDDAILYIERILAEALQMQRTRRGRA